MGRTLLKKRFGIPAVLLVALVLTGAATALLISTFTHKVTIIEPLNFNETTNETSDITSPGDSGQIIVEVTNNSTSENYGIYVDTDIENAKRIDSLTYSTENRFGTEQAGGADWNGDGDNWDAKYTVSDNSTGNGLTVITITINTAPDGYAGGVGVDLRFHRKAQYTTA